MMTDGMNMQTDASFDGTYVLDPDAGSADIRKLHQANELLTQAKQKLINLQAAADGMTGETANAISDKSAELQKRISHLTEIINTASSYIADAVDAYLAFDAEHAGNIRT